MAALLHKHYAFGVAAHKIRVADGNEFIPIRLMIGSFTTLNYSVTIITPTISSTFITRQVAHTGI